MDVAVAENVLHDNTQIHDRMITVLNNAQRLKLISKGLHPHPGNVCLPLTDRDFFGSYHRNTISFPRKNIICSRKKAQLSLKMGHKPQAQANSLTLKKKKKISFGSIYI
jgi:hypothetical protein